MNALYPFAERLRCCRYTKAVLYAFWYQKCFSQCLRRAYAWQHSAIIVKIPRHYNEGSAVQNQSRCVSVANGIFFKIKTIAMQIKGVRQLYDKFVAVVTVFWTFQKIFWSSATAPHSHAATSPRQMQKHLWRSFDKKIAVLKTYRNTFCARIGAESVSDCYQLEFIIPSYITCGLSIPGWNLFSCRKREDWNKCHYVTLGYQLTVW